MATVIIAHFIAIPISFGLGAYNAVFSQNVIPHLYGKPAAFTTPIFAKVFDIGSATIAPLAASGIFAYTYLAWNTQEPKYRRRYIASACLMLSSLPMTAIVMKPGISRLIQISKSVELQARKGTDAEATRLLQQWVKQNAFRSCLHFVAGFVGLYNAVK